MNAYDFFLIVLATIPFIGAIVCFLFSGTSTKKQSYNSSFSTNMDKEIRASQARVKAMKKR